MFIFAMSGLCLQFWFFGDSVCRSCSSWQPLGCLEPHPLQAFTECSQCGGALLAEVAEDVRHSCRVYGWV